MSMLLCSEIIPAITDADFGSMVARLSMIISVLMCLHVCVKSYKFVY